MNVDKIRNLTDIELNHQQRELADQLFKMKFQLKMGQTESLKKIRELKKDIARIQTVKREKELAGGNGSAPRRRSKAKRRRQGRKAKPSRRRKRPSERAPRRRRRRRRPRRRLRRRKSKPWPKQPTTNAAAPAVARP